MLFIGALIFIPRGTLNYWQGWAFMAVFAAVAAAYTVYLVRFDPALLRRRMERGVANEKETAQKKIVALLYIAFIALVVVPPLDVRYGWSHMPWYDSLMGDALIVFAFYVFYLVAKVNSYAASTVKVEQGQTVVSTGVYSVVRHPMYLGALFTVAGIALALGSWWALLLAPLVVVILSLRITNEEQVLLRDLAGYAEYRQKVRHRLIPLIW
jgi:protein-S-isoprenylcysteine O-methyltransferase Ste14